MPRTFHNVKKAFHLFLITNATLLSFSFFFKVTNAQNINISGIIADKNDNKKLSGVTVSLLNSKDSNVIKMIVTNNNGEFKFTDISKGDYIIKATIIGFKNYLQSINANNSDENNIGNILLEKSSSELQNLTVVSKGAAIVQKDDTSQYNSKQYIKNKNSLSTHIISKFYFY